MRTSSIAYRSAVGFAIAAMLVLFWLSLGVGIIGKNGDSANVIYFGLLTGGVIGSLISRLSTPWNSPRVFGDSAHSDLGHIDRVTRRFGSLVERTVGANCLERVLRRTVCGRRGSPSVLCL